MRAHEDPRLGHLPACLGLVDGDRAWMIDATPALPTQLARLAAAAGHSRLDGILLTHAHVGHYMGLLHLGPEAAAVQALPLRVMPRMAEYLRVARPWADLVDNGQVVLEPLAAGVSLELTPNLSVTPRIVPHRDEDSETVAFLIRGPVRTALYLPDIDGWEEWDEDLVELLGSVDVAWIDGTFFADGELLDRDDRLIPHPRITQTLARLAGAPSELLAKVRFTHLNHTNPVLYPDSDEHQEVLDAGCEVAREGERFALG